MKVINVVGARPNFMKIAPIMDCMKKDPFFEPYLVHTGQHYDEAMSSLFFDQLGIPKPDINLEVGSGSHGHQTGEIMIRFDELLDKLDFKPDLLIVVGDVNSTIACAMVATKRGIGVAHVEAGLRSHDLDMPEEINRILTDSISDILFTTSRDADENLVKVGIKREQIFFVGNVMIDTLRKNKELADRSDILEKMKLEPKNYSVLTLHRPSNVDDQETFGNILKAVAEISNKLPVIFPIHPRTIKMAEKFGLDGILKNSPGIVTCSPLGPLEFFKLMSESKIMLTDSGGIQEETTVLGVPCLTLRHNTERPITVTEGTNRLVGNDTAKILGAAEEILQGKMGKASVPEYWDGRAAQRIIDVLKTMDPSKLKRMEG